MSIFLISLVAVLSICYLLVRINQRDPFADENARSLFFPGFRVQRSFAKTSFLAISVSVLSAGIMAALAANAMTAFVAVLSSFYFVAGSVFVLREIDNLTYERRSADPMLHGIALLVTWPVWKSRYRLNTRIN